MAADGGCRQHPDLTQHGLQICAIQSSAIESYMKQHQHNKPTAERMMRVLYESIEDLYFLSQCDSLVTQGTSYYSTLAGFLIWARIGETNPSHSLLLLDKDNTVLGRTPSAYLPLFHDTVKPSSNLYKNGEERWIQHTQYFISGLDSDPAPGVISNAIEEIDPWESNNRLKIVNGLPRIPDKVFYIESKSWLGNTSSMWKGKCRYHSEISIESAIDYITWNVNQGVDHWEMKHGAEAINCWREGYRVMHYPQLQQVLKQTAPDSLDIVITNLKAVSLQRYALYSAEISKYTQPGRIQSSIIFLSQLILARLNILNLSFRIIKEIKLQRVGRF